MESDTNSEAVVREIEAAFEGVGVAGGFEAEIEPWCGLGALAFRARLPGAMARAVRGADGRGLRWWLTLPLSGDEEIHLSKWALLDARQRACVARFLRHMSEAARAAGHDDEASLWEEAYESHWEP